MKKRVLMLKLKPKFQKQIFTEFIDKFGGSGKACLLLKIPQSSLLGYRNLYFKSVPSLLIDRLISFALPCSKDLDKNLISSFIRGDQIKKVLDLGRKIRSDELKKFSSDIPRIEEIISDKYILLDRWFEKYIFLLNIGFRKIEYEYYNNWIIVRYKNFARKKFKQFTVKFPRKIRITEEFSYFLGLWCGDRAGGGRFGVTNKNQEIISFTEKFLKKYDQKIEKILYIQDNLQSPKISYDKRVNHHTRKGWVLSVHSTNGILASFFRYLGSNLGDLLEYLDKYAFFAGLFDAEGNVSLYNKSLRTACKDEDLIKIYTKYLTGLNLYDRYDGSCLITYNIKEFNNKIGSLLKNSDKISLLNFMCDGAGEMPFLYLHILRYVNSHPDRTSKELAQALKRNKIYSELKLLSDFGYLNREGSPYRYEISNKGQKSLGA